MPLNTNALTTTHEIREALGITDLNSDRIIERLINGVSSAFARVAGRVFQRDPAVVEDVAGLGTVLVMLKQTPIVSITSVQTIADDGTLGTAESATSYRILNADVGSIFRATGWTTNFREAYGILSYAVRGSEIPNFRITYVGGWVTRHQTSTVFPGGQVDPTATLPGEIEEAVIRDCVTNFRSIGRPLDVSEQRLGDETVKWRSDVAAVNQQSRIDLSPAAHAVALAYRNGAEY